MPVTDFRQRTAVLFIAVMLGHIILISAQVNSRAGVPLLEVVTFGAFAEVQRGAAGLTGGIRDAWSGYVGSARRARRERAAEAAARRAAGAVPAGARAGRARAAARAAARISAAICTLKRLPASVIGAGASLEFRGITIDRGSNTGVTTNMAVIAPTGLVGRIVTPTAHASKVQLLIDRNAAAGALVERSRAQGIVVGHRAAKRLLRMDFVAATADVKVGDTIVTSGIDGIYPKGFVIGKVETVDNGNGIYKAIRVRPSVDFNRLEEVLVVKTPPRQTAQEEGRS